MISLAAVLRRRGDYEGAKGLYRESLGIFREALGDRHPYVAASLNNMAMLHHYHGDHAQAEPLMDEAPVLLLVRSVRELLMNVIKHAGPVATEVRLKRRPDALEIEVVNEPSLLTPPPGPTRKGHGLVGMAERVSLFGGHSEAGPLPHGGYRVWVVLPVIE